MSIRVLCPSCDHELRLADRYRGKKVRCPSCETPVRVGGSGSDVDEQSRPQRKARSESRRPESRGRSQQGSPKFRSRSRREKPQRRASGAKAFKASLGIAILGAVVAVAVFGGIVVFMRSGGETQPEPLADVRESAVEDSSAATIETQQPTTSVASNQATQASPTTWKPAPFEYDSTSPEPAVNDSANNTGGNQTASTTNSATNNSEPTNNGLSTLTAERPAAAVPSGGMPEATSVSEMSLTELVEFVKPAVVRINIETTNNLGNGSGYLVGPDTIVTNYHVIEGAVRLNVVFADDRRFNVEGFVHLDAPRDIAVIKIKNPNAENVRYLKVAGDTPKVGTSVAAIGAPLGLDFTVSEGIVSSVRSTEEMSRLIRLKDHKGTWIQTTAPISSGNSGGPLVNMKGEVVAMNTMQLTIGQNLNFAISCKDIQNGLNNVDATVTHVSPTTVPEYHTSHDEPPGGNRSGDPNEAKPDIAKGIEIVDIIGTKEATSRLSKFTEVRYEFMDLTEKAQRQISAPSSPFSRSGDGGSTMTVNVPLYNQIVDRIRSNVNNTIEKRLSFRTVHHDAPTMFVFVRSKGTSTVEFIVNIEMLDLDKSNGRPRLIRIWRDSGSVMSVTQQAMARGIVPKGYTKKISELVMRLRNDIRSAKVKHAAD